MVRRISENMYLVRMADGWHRARIVPHKGCGTLLDEARAGIRPKPRPAKGRYGVGVGNRWTRRGQMQ